MSFYDQIDLFSVPSSYFSSFELFISPIKEKAKKWVSDAHSLTECQHEIAKQYFGFSDWQSFHYFAQKAYNEIIPNLPLTRDEWIVIFDLYNGCSQSYEESLLESMDTESIQTSFLNCFRDSSIQDATEKTRVFLNTIEKFNQDDINAIHLAISAFWKDFIIFHLFDETKLFR